MAATQLQKNLCDWLQRPLHLWEVIIGTVCHMIQSWRNFTKSQMYFLYFIIKIKFLQGLWQDGEGVRFQNSVFSKLIFAKVLSKLKKMTKKKIFLVLLLGLTSALFPPLKSFALILLFGLFISFTLSYFVFCFFFLFFTSFINSFSFYFIHSVLVLSRTWNIEDLCLAF